MSITAKCEGEGAYAGLVSKLRTKKDVDQIMTYITKGFSKKSKVSWDEILSVQNLYAREFYKYAKSDEIKEALRKYFCVEDL